MVHGTETGVKPKKELHLDQICLFRYFYVLQTTFSSLTDRLRKPFPSFTHFSVPMFLIPRFQDGATAGRSLSVVSLRAGPSPLCVFDYVAIVDYVITRIRN